MGLGSLIFILVIGINCATAASTPDAPVYSVFDPAALLSPIEARSLEFLLTEHDRATSEQVVIALVPSLEGQDVDLLTGEIFKAWKVGKRNRGSGVLLAVYLKEYEMRVEVGHGLEAALSMQVARRILDEELKPELHSRPALGVQRAVYRLLAELHSPLLDSPQALEIAKQFEATSDTPNAILPPRSSGKWGPWGVLLWALATGLGVFAWWFNIADEAHFSAEGWLPYHKIALKQWPRLPRRIERPGARSVSGRW